MRDVNQRGPEAWRSHFAESPAFFMASEGRLVFPSSDAATQGIEELTHLIRSMTGNRTAHCGWGGA